MIARSYLYVPGNRRDMLDKAAAGDADALIADLEDGVADAAKDEARATVGEWAATTGVGERLWVRVNNDPQRLAADIAAVHPAGIAGIYLPKATPRSVAAASGHMAASVRAARGKPGPRIIALIESAEGLAGATEIAGIPLVARLAIGEADLGADLGIDATLPETTWLPIRLQIVIASAAASLDAPVGPVLTDFRNDSRLKESTVGLKRIGFGARAAIHPRQVAVINEAFIPSADEVAAARDLVTRFEQARATGAAVMISDDGTMADEATVRHARLILERAGPSTGS